MTSRAPRQRSVWRPLAMATVGGAVLVTMGVGVWATLNATASTVDPQAVSNGTLKLTMADRGTGFSQGIGNLAPGDVVNRYVDLTNGGTLDGQALTLKVTGTGSTALTTDATRGLKVTVTEYRTTRMPSLNPPSSLPAVVLGRTQAVRRHACLSLSEPVRSNRPMPAPGGHLNEKSRETSGGNGFVYGADELHVAPGLSSQASAVDGIA